MVFPVGIGQHPASKIVRVHWSTRELEPVFLKNQKQESTRGRGPSDCIAMATALRAPIYVSLDVWNEVEDMTDVLRKMQEEGPHAEESNQEEDS
jgi:hypothetical protein